LKVIKWHPSVSLEETYNEMADDKARLNHKVKYALRQITEHDGSAGIASNLRSAGVPVEYQPN
jgi:enoyl-[acyl-carrier-protein] reductase (NADH)